jgi:hypothetical protein
VRELGRIALQELQLHLREAPLEFGDHRRQRIARLVCVTATERRPWARAAYSSPIDLRLVASCVTREPVLGAMRDRVTRLLASGVLEENLGLKLDHDRSRIMLCGNPDMVEDARGLLFDRGFRVSRRGDPGHLAVENYW